MKKQLVRYTVFLLSVLLLTGCWQEEPLEPNDFSDLLQEGQEVQSEGTLLPEAFSLPYVPGYTLDPITCPDGMQQVISSLLCEGLFRQGPDFEPEPWLCDSYTHDVEMRVFTFTLKPDITFSDGSPLTAADVKITLQRAKASPRYQARLSNVSSIETDGDTVTITLTEPNSALPALLDIPIVKAGSEREIPIGTGPYFFSTEDTRHCLIANQTWWRQEIQPVDRMMLVEASDPETMLYRFTSHDVQLVTADLTGTAAIHVTGDIRYQDTNTTILQYLGCNTQQAPMNSSAFRRALNLGINRSNIVSAYFSGHGTPTQFPLPPCSPLYPAELESPFSHDAFVFALSESGYIAERTLTLLVNSENHFKLSAAQYLAEMYTAAGIPMEVQALPWEEYVAALSAGAFDLYYGEVRLTADWDLTSLLGVAGNLNYTGWAAPQTSQLLAAYAVSSDRAAAMKELCSHLQLYAPILPICFKSTSVLLQSDVVRILSPTMMEPFYQLENCSIQLKNTTELMP